MGTVGTSLVPTGGMGVLAVVVIVTVGTSCSVGSIGMRVVRGTVGTPCSAGVVLMSTLGTSCSVRASVLKIYIYIYIYTPKKTHRHIHFLKCLTCKQMNFNLILKVVASTYRQRTHRFAGHSVASDMCTLRSRGNIEHEAVIQSA
jgi:hypothetical protein